MSLDTYMPYKYTLFYVYKTINTKGYRKKKKKTPQKRIIPTKKGK